MIFMGLLAGRDAREFNRVSGISLVPAAGSIRAIEAVYFAAA